MGSVLSGIFGTKNNYQYDPNAGGSATTIQQNYGNENNLATALQNQANGTGPNPAQQMLNQATDNNIKSSASLMASQKGINPGSTQRQVALNGANQNQAAAGQAATLGAQQQVAAQGQLGNLYGQIGSQGIAQQTAGNSVNAGVAQQNTQTAGQLAGGLINGLGSIGAAFATGGASAPLTLGAQQAKAIESNGMQNSTALPAAQNTLVGDGLQFAAHGGKPVGNTMLSPGEKVKFPGASKMATVPGKAPVKGDSPKNDIVPANLPQGTEVVPRSKASDATKTKQFLDHLNSFDPKKGKAPSYEDIAKLQAQIAALKKKVKA